MTKEVSKDHLSLSQHREVLKDFSRSDPDDSLHRIVGELREALRCETACILLWDEGEQKLITRYQSGLPKNLGRPEEYGLHEGITGKYIFSHGRLINGLVDPEREFFTDLVTGDSISDSTINWHNIRVFKGSSEFEEFKSMLAAPCFNKNQKLGVIKLINKIDEGTGRLAEGGFGEKDVETFRLVLNTVEFILQSRWNEKRVEDLFTLISKNADAGSSYEEVLNEMVANCAGTLNYRVCVVRLLENDRLNTKACNQEFTPPDDYTADDDPPLLAVSEAKAYKWRVESAYDLSPVVITDFGGNAKSFKRISRRVSSLIRRYDLKSALIVPITRGGRPLGTFECYTSLPRDFTHHEKDVISKYASSLITALQRFKDSERLSQIERLTQVINEVLKKESRADLYRLILTQTIEFFGFDYGAISMVDYKTRRVKTESGISAKPLLVNPDDWLDESDYSLDDEDILVDVINNKRSVIISGPEVEKSWDPRLNRSIYDKHNHKELVRIFVPFILRETGALGRQDADRKLKSIEENVLGVIEAGYHVSRCRGISEDQRTLFELFINYCAVVVQRLLLDEEKVALDKILEKLNTQKNLLSSAQEIYDTLKEVVEAYLGADTVSVWEKKTTNEPSGLRLVAASEPLRRLYDREGIQELPPDSITAAALAGGKVTEVPREEVRSQKFAHPQIASEQNLDSMIVIPISIGQETYAVINVFFGPDRRLTAEEKDFLEQFAGRAAVVMIAVQNAKLVNSFSSISESLLDEDIENILQSITDSALEVLHANPVILFRYEADQNEFLPGLITSGDFYRPEVKDIPTEVKENDWPNIILNLKRVAVYLEDEEQYLDFQREVKRTWRGDRFDRDFWHREGINSLAALRLEHKSEPVGIMFVNYRRPQQFNDPTKKLIEAFAAQAASAIANAKYVAQNRKLWDMQRRDSFSLSVSEVIASLAHNSGNLLHVISMRFAALDDYVKRAVGKVVEKDKVQTHLAQLKAPLEELVEDFNRLEDYRKFDEFEEGECRVEELLDSSLQMLRTRFERKKISIKRSYANTPQISCDKHQIQHMLLNLLLNALDATGRKGVVSVGTELKDGNVRIRVTDTGTGIAPDDHSKIFKPFFTTKKHGSGLGLPISQYIARMHGGRIDFTSKSKETNFYVYLPVERQGE